MPPAKSPPSCMAPPDLLPEEDEKAPTVFMADDVGPPPVWRRGGTDDACLSMEEGESFRVERDVLCFCLGEGSLSLGGESGFVFVGDACV